MMRRLIRDESGQGLITVLFTTMIILALVVAATTITAAQSVPARQTVDRAAALAAAEGGLQDFLADVSGCPDTVDCGWIVGAEKGQTLIGDGGASFTWRVLSVDDKLVRVESIGRYSHDGGKDQTKTLVGDFIAGAELTDFLYYSTYETQSQELIEEQFPPRDIAMRNASGWTYDGTIPAGPIHWDGVSDGRTPEGYPSVTSCDLLWYDPDEGGENSRENAKTSSPGSVDWGETGNVGRVHGGTCEVMFTTGSIMNGDVYSKDAFLISSSTRDSGGPIFRGRVLTEYPSPDEARFYRSLNDASPLIGSVERSQTSVSLPEWSEPPLTTCTYTGPTFITAHGSAEDHEGYLSITSPLTPADDSDDCFASKSDDRTGLSLGTGESVYEARIPMDSGITVLVKNADGDAEPVMAPQDPLTQRDVTNALFWSADRDATTTSGLSTTMSDDVTLADAPERDHEQAQLDEEEFIAATGLSYEDVRTDLVAKLDNSHGDPEYANIAYDEVVRKALGEVFAEAATELADEATDEDPAPELRLDSDELHIIIDDGELVYSIDTDDIHESKGDPSDVSIAEFAEATTASSSATVETRMRDRIESVDLSISRLDCSLITDEEGLACGDHLDATSREILYATSTRTHEKDYAETRNVSAFPVSSDRTEYNRTTGDVYIEGTVAGKVSVVAENDIVVTGDLLQQDGRLQPAEANGVEDFRSPSDAIVLSANNNVRVYHPVSCLEDVEVDESTTAGFCPDDITGLYDEGIPSDRFNEIHPSRQYENLADEGGRQIDAAVYALNGSFVLDNHDKGPALGALQLNGAVYQEHRGAMGVEWEIRADDPNRPSSGYGLDYHYDSTLPTKQFPFIPSDGRTHVGAWTLVGTSEILNEEILTEEGNE